MSGKISEFLSRIFSPSNYVFLRENEKLREEVRLLKEELNEHRWEMTEAKDNASAELEQMFDEMTEHVRASQLEIIDSLYQQMMAAEMMRQKQTDQLNALSEELTAVRSQLCELQGLSPLTDEETDSE